MSMTLDDLKLLFQKARQGTRDWNGTEWVGDWGGDDAGIRRVVEALRDEMWRNDDAVIRFNEILAQSEDRQAGVLAVESREVAMAPEATEAPAAAPSPEVCEWRMVGKTFANAGCEDEYLWSHEYKVCPSCGKPIVFKEPKP